MTLVVLIRARVARFHPSMWLDGVIGALGTIGGRRRVPARALPLRPAPAPALPVVELVMPTTDVLLLALLVAVGSILGARLDRTLLLVAAAMCCVLVGDVVLFARTVAGTYADGGPLELTWLAGICLAALAAHGARPPAAPRNATARSRVGWRLLALPLACNVASLVVLAVGWGDDMPVVAAWLAIGCVLAAIARTAVTFREVRSFNEIRQQARTDELSGLPNRRALLDERPADARRTRRPPGRPRCSCWTWTASRRSTTAWATTPATSCCARSGPRLRGGPAARRPARPGWAATSSPSCCPTSASTRRRRCAERLRELVLAAVHRRGHPAARRGEHRRGHAPRCRRPPSQELLRCADVAMYAAKAARAGVHVYVPDPDGGTGDRLRTHGGAARRRWRSTTSSWCTSSRRSASPTAGSSAPRRWSAGSTRPAGCSAPPSCCPPPSRRACCGRSPTRSWSCRSTAAARWWPQRARAGLGEPVGGQRHRPRPARQGGRTRWSGTACPPAALTLELVEDTLMADPERGRTVLGELRRLGVRTSIDDYGTGYSSLAYLRHLPADELKLDRSLTADVGTDPRAAAIVEHTVALAHDLGPAAWWPRASRTTATGAVLARLGCDVAQGYAIARPMPVDATSSTGWPPSAVPSSRRTDAAR